MPGEEGAHREAGPMQAETEIKAMRTRDPGQLPVNGRSWERSVEQIRLQSREINARVGLT